MDLLPYMEQWHMLPSPGGTVLCAVSGGRDSVCLLHYLRTLGAEHGFTVAAAHLNHLMRPTALRDVAFLADFCRAREISLYVEERDVRALAAQQGIGEEEAGRKARYDFLERTARQIGAERIATAHHRRDQAETVMLNLLRGTGPEGLGGIPPVRGPYIRPLLDTPRQEIEQYLKENGLTHIEDETNESRAYARNRLRLDVWPALEGLHSGAEENVARAARVIRRENVFLDELAREYLPREGTEISCTALQSAPEALRSRVVRLLLARLPAGKKDVTAAHVEAVLALCGGKGWVSLPAGMGACCDGETLRVQMVGEIPPALSLQPGENRWGGYTVTWQGTGKAIVRSWRSEDRMTLPGSRGSRSLKRLFAERGIVPPERETLPVVTVDGRVAAACGVGADEAFLQENKIFIDIKKTVGGRSTW